MYYIIILLLPAIHAVMKQATLPAIIALTTIFVISLFLDGAIAPNAPSIIPIDPILEKPQRAYVAITTVLSCNKNGDSYWILHVILY